MADRAKPIPERYPGVTPYLCVGDAAAAIESYRKALGAVEVMRIGAPGRKIGPAQIRIAGAPIMLSDQYPDMGARSPRALGGSPVTMHLYVEDVDAFAGRAVAAGAKVKWPVADQFYGDRGRKLEDPFGHIWWIATHHEEVSAEETRRRAEALFTVA